MMEVVVAPSYFWEEVLLVQGDLYGVLPCLVEVVHAYQVVGVCLQGTEVVSCQEVEVPAIQVVVGASFLVEEEGHPVLGMEASVDSLDLVVEVLDISLAENTEEAELVMWEELDFLVLMKGAVACALEEEVLASADLGALAGMEAFPWVASGVVSSVVMRGVASVEVECSPSMKEAYLGDDHLAYHPLVEVGEEPWMWAVLDQEVVVEEAGHQQTADVVCLSRRVDSWQPIISLQQIRVFLLWSLS